MKAAQPTFLQNKILVIVGATASGKSSLAMQMAERYDGEIIGCDSVQIYQGFDIGSAKPTGEERQRIPHHLVDTLTWDAEFDAAMYATSALKVIDGIRARGRLPIVVGGTGLYLRALLGARFHMQLPKDGALREQLQQQSSGQLFANLQRLDPHRAAQLHVNDRFRVIRALELVFLTGKPAAEHQQLKSDVNLLASYTINIHPPRAMLHARIALRVQQMLADGLLAEVEQLLAKGVEAECKPMQSIGYKQCVAYLHGRMPVGKTLEQSIVEATRQYAKRQVTWFKKSPCDLLIENADAAWKQIETV